MNLGKLIPAPCQRDTFLRARERFIPERRGCYVLTTFEGEVMYVGLAGNLRRRFNQHLDSEGKTTVTKIGKAIFFCWLENEELNKVERTWMNIHLQNEGVLPILNRNYSPTSV